MNNNEKALCTLEIYFRITFIKADGQAFDILGLLFELVFIETAINFLQLRPSGK